MKLALLHDSILPPKTYGGIERVLMLLARELKKLGHHVVIISKPQSQIADFEHIPLPENFENYKNFLPSDLDFLHSHQPLAYEPPIPYLITVHGNAKVGEAFFSNSCFLSQSHARNHNAKYFVYNGLDVEDYPFSEHKNDTLAFLAKASWRVKNLKTAIHCAKDLGLDLEIMGGQGISDKCIHYHGLVGEDVKRKILPTVRALVYPTNWDEPFGMAVLEAMACGTPVVASANGAMSELISEKTGRICTNYQRFLQAIQEVRNCRPRDCRLHVETNFSAKKMALEYLKLYERILDNRSLDHSPRYNFKPESVHYLYKPTLLNRVIFRVRGKI